MALVAAEWFRALIPTLDCCFETFTKALRSSPRLNLLRFARGTSDSSISSPFVPSRVRFQLVGQNIGDRTGHCEIDTGVRCGSGTMVVRDGLNGTVGQGPKIRAGMRLSPRVKFPAFLFRIVEFASAFGCSGGGGRELIRHLAGQNQSPYRRIGAIHGADRCAKARALRRGPSGIHAAPQLLLCHSQD